MQQPHLAPPEPALGLTSQLDGINGLSIPQADLHIVRKVGSGKFSDVYEASVYGCRVAVKIPRPESAALKDAYLELFRLEAHNLSKVIHHNVGRIYGFVFVGSDAPQDRGQIWLVCEFLEGGTLQSMLDGGLINRTGHPMSLYARMKMARDIVKGMIFVHKHCLCHHDLKPDNIMFDHHGVLKVVDFGYAEKIKPGELIRSQQLKGSPLVLQLWMAPEVMSLGQYNEKSDVYSWALLCWQLLTKSPYPFPHEGIAWKTFRDNVVNLGVRPQIPAQCIVSIRYLLMHSWDPNPEKRLSFLEIDTYFEGILLECAVQDEYARRFWAENFGSPLLEKVRWEEFVARFFAFLQLPPPDTGRPPRRRDQPCPPLSEASSEADLRLATGPQLELFAMSSPRAAALVRQEVNRRESVLWAAALKEMLAPKYSPAGYEKDMVYLERFGKITNQFGPILWNSIATFFQGIRAVLQKPWYKGDLTREQTYRVLINKPPGTFLVRMSAHPDHACVISVVLTEAARGSAGHPIGHYVIVQEPGKGFCLDVDTQQRTYYPTLPMLVDDFIRTGFLQNTCSFDWRDICIDLGEDAEMLDEEALPQLANLDQYTKSFLRQLPAAVAEPVQPKRMFQSTAPNNATDGLKWSVFAASMVPPPRSLDLGLNPATEPYLAEHQQRLSQRLEFYRLTFRRMIPPDGNCQFAAAADQIYGRIEKAGEIRNLVAQWLRHNQKLPTGEGRSLDSYIAATSWEHYCAWIATPGAWGDHLSLFAISQVFQVRITIVSSIPGSHFIITVNPRQPAQPERAILLAHWGELHYGSLCPIPEDPHELPSPKRSRSGSNPPPPAAALNGSPGHVSMLPNQARGSQGLPALPFPQWQPSPPHASPNLLPQSRSSGSPPRFPYLPLLPANSQPLSPAHHALLYQMANSPPARAIIAQNSPPQSPDRPVQPGGLRLSNSRLGEQVYPPPTQYRAEGKMQDAPPY